MSDFSNISSTSLVDLLKPDKMYASVLPELTALSTKISSFPAPPSLAFLAGNDQKLKDIASLFHKILSNSTSILFCEQDLNDLENSFCVFANEVSKRNDPAEYLSYSKSISQKMGKASDSNEDDLMDLLEDQKKHEEETNKLIASMRDEISSLNELLSEKSIEYQKLHLKLNEMRKSYEDEIKTLKEEHESAIQDSRTMFDKANQDSYAYSRSIEKINSMSEEIANLKSENHNLTMKLQAKNTKLEFVTEYKLKQSKKEKEYEAEREKMLVILNEYRSRLNKAYNIVKKKSSFIETSTSPKKQTNKVSKETESVIKMQSEELKQLYEKQGKLFVSITKMNDLLTRAENMIFDSNKELKRLRYTNKSLKKGNEKLKEENSNLMKENEELNTEKLKEEGRNKEMMNLLGAKKGETPSDTVYRLANERTNEDDKFKRLVSLIQSQLTKIGSFLIDCKGSSQNIKNYAMIERDSYISLLNELKEDLHTSKTMNEFMDRLSAEDTISTEEALIILTTEIQNNALLGKHLDEMRNKCDNYENIFKKISKAANVEGSFDEVATEVINHYDDYRRITRKILNSVGKKESKMPLGEILNIFIEMNRIISLFDIAVRRIVEYEGKISDLPQFICEYVTDLKEKAVKAENKARNNDLISKENLYMNSENRITEAFKEDIESKNKKIYELQKQISNLEHENLILKQQADDSDLKSSFLKDKLSIATNELANLTDKTSNLEEENKSIKNEIVSLEKKYNEKIKSIKNQYDSETELMRTNYNEKNSMIIKDLKNNLGNKTNKIAKIKRKLNDVSIRYEKVFNEQKDTIEALKNQNEQLSNTTMELSMQLDKPADDTDKMKKMKSLISVKKVENAALQQKVKMLEKNIASIKEIIESKYQNKVKAILKSGDANKEVIKSMCSAFKVEYKEDREEMEESINKRIAIIEKTKLWEKWGRKLYSSITKYPSNRIEDAVIMNALENIIESSKQQISLTKKMDLLRQQKDILNVLMNKEIKFSSNTGTLQSLRTMTLFLVFIQRMRNKQKQRN